MNPRRLTLRNFRSYSELDLELPRGCTAIVGANGVGKSSIVTALEVALFGARKMRVFYPEEGGVGPMVVELLFDHAGEVYRVRRTYTEGGPTKLDFEQLIEGDLWGALTRETAAATQEAIDELLGLTRETFRASAFLAQGDGAAFTEAQPRDRKKILADALDLDLWADLHDRARDDRRAALEEIQRQEAVVFAAEKRLEGVEGLRARADGFKVEIADATRKADAAQDALAQAQTRLLEAERAAGGFAEAERLAHQAMEETKRLLREHEERCEEVGRSCENARKEFTRYVREREEARDQVGAIVERIATLGAKTETFTATSECPTCGTALVDPVATGKVQANMARQERDMRGLLESQEQRAQRADVAARELADAADPERARARIAELTAEHRGAYDAAAQRERDAIAHAQSFADKEAALERARLNVSDAMKNHQAAVGTVTLLEREEAEVLARLRLADEAALERDQARSSIVLQEGFAAIYTRLEHAYGRDGVPALIVENVAIPQIEQDANAVLEQLGVSFRVELHTQRETAAGGAADTLDIVVGGRPYETYSGGEKTKLNLALRIGLARLLARRGGRCEVLVIDEPEFLDDAGLEALAGVLRSLPEFDRTLLISHVPGLRDAFDSTLEVVKDGGRSRVAGLPGSVQPVAALSGEGSGE